MFLVEKANKNKPLIVVDVQPAYIAHINQYNPKLMSNLVDLLANHNGPILMFINANETGMTDDDVEHDIFPFWEEQFAENGYDPEETFWALDITWIDKGYGGLRGWIDQGFSDNTIIKTIREMYNQRIDSSEELFQGDTQQIENFIGEEFDEGMLDNPIHINWISIANLKKFQNGYICGGGKHECLKEVLLFMQAFNIKTTQIREMIY